MQIMLIDDRPYTAFPSGPKNEEAVASSCLNVVTALVNILFYILLLQGSCRKMLRIGLSRFNLCENFRACVW